MRSPIVLLLIATLALACDGDEPRTTPPSLDAVADSPSSGDAGRAAETATGATDAGACLPLATIDATTCPATWDAAITEHVAFCAREWEGRGGLFSADRSTTACAGFLRYTRYLFDGGPRFCLYDPATHALRGYRADSTKSMYHAITCGSSPDDYLVKDCPVVTCAHVALGLPACTWSPSLDNFNPTSGDCHAARTLLSCPGTGATTTCLSNEPTRCSMDSMAPTPCTALCATGDYAVACGKPGPGPAPTPPAGCKDMRPTPGGVAFYCCPCGS